MLENRIDLPQGTLDLLILRSLRLGPNHGWAIAERIQQVSKEVLQVQQGSLYPAQSLAAKKPAHRFLRAGVSEEGA